MKTIKEFIYILILRIFVTTILSIVCILFCDYHNFRGDMPTSLIGITKVFPIVFVINEAFKRRDKVLQNYGILNANLFSIYFAFLNWSPKKFNRG